MKFERAHKRAVLRLAMVFTAAAACLAAAPQVRMRGFLAQSAAWEQQTEKQFLASASPQQVREFHRYLTAEPHPAGSQRNNELAQWVAQQWKQQGLENVQVHEYDVLNSTPKSALVEMVAPTHFRASLREDAYPEDPDTKDPRVSGAYLGYSASGDVTAPVVYAHSGNPADYELLRKHGIDVRGKIVLVRYSNPYSYRGFKAYTAQKLGVAALLIYSDPAEDGYVQGKVFPKGPWGPASHIQRGSITYDFLEPGDPTTPGWASVPGAKHISPNDAISMPHIIALPLSWRDAEPILKNMGGPAAPKDWQGGLPFTYHMGGAHERLHVNVQMNQNIEPYYDVEARIEGSEHPDEWIVLGNHRDAWVFGGVDPSSGTASMLELTRDLGALLRKGIRPKRTLVFCDWDGEEYALTGSTEWGEQYADELKKKAIAYLNVDSSASGPNFDGSAVGSLAPLLVEVSRDLRAPSGGTLYDEWRVSRARELKQKTVADSDLAETRIGSGSDHTVFLNYLGIPTMLLQFDGPYGVYHSMYDDFYWINHFGDPGYRYHTLMTQLWGVVSLRLADSDVLPYDFVAYAGEIRKYVHELDEASHVSGHLDLGPLYQSVDAFEKAARELDATSKTVLARSGIDRAAADKLNRALMEVERNWCDPSGIPGRPWFKHTLYAARYTYAHLELPGMTEAAEAGNWKLAGEQQQILERELQKNTELLASSTHDFDNSTRLSALNRTSHLH
jgi:N-acetylated-alpha-linked acidic dipeptidase